MAYEELDKVRDEMLDMDGRLDDIGKEIGEQQEKIKAIESVIGGLSEEISEALDETKGEIESTVNDQKENAAEIVVELGRLEAEVEQVKEVNDRDREALQALAGTVEVGQLQGQCEQRRSQIEAYKEWLSSLTSKASLLAGLRGGEPPRNLPV